MMVGDDHSRSRGGDVWMRGAEPRRAARASLHAYATGVGVAT